MRYLGLAILIVGLFFACSKKSTSFNNSKSFVASLQTQSNDAIRISNELDNAINDVDSALAGATSICGATIVVDSVDSPRVIDINYNGNSCDALRTRTGSIGVIYTPGTDWNTPGDSVTLYFNPIVITRKSDGKPLTIKGILVYKNVTGGTLDSLAGGGAPIVHTLIGTNLSIKFDDSTLSNWSFARQRTYTYSSGLLISTIGLDSAGNIGGVADWGGNRFGNSVVVVPTTPIQLSQSCGWKITGGTETMTNPIGLSTLTFGLDTTGKPAGCPVNGGHFYYGLSWTGDGESPYSGVVPY